MHSYDTLSQAIEDLKQRGYTEDFNLKPHCIINASKKLELHPENFTVEEYYRFEGESNPDDSSVIFAIKSNTGMKGILVDAYGMYAEKLTSEMSQKLTILNQD
jgi:hypothetical protein